MSKNREEILLKTAREIIEIVTYSTDSDGRIDDISIIEQEIVEVINKAIPHQGGHHETHLGPDAAGAPDPCDQ